MKTLRHVLMFTVALSLSLATMSFAQTETDRLEPNAPEEGSSEDDALNPSPPDNDVLDLEDIRPEVEILSDPEEENPAALEGVLNTGPDYSHLTKSQERAARLDILFERLKSAEDSDAAELIAEEVWALWLDSGSATVDMILLRGTAFEKRGETQAARRMYDHVTTLLPDYAEGWARSARLAMEEEDYDRALAESATALIHEPREIYALWTMGNVLEKLGRSAQALASYEEALKLYPTHPAIKARVVTLNTQLDGEVL